MKLVSFHQDRRTGWGMVEGNEIIDLTDAFEGIGSLKKLLGSGRVGELATAAAGKPRLSFDAVQFLPVIPDPAKILCIGINYMAHVKETGREPPKAPTVFVRYPDCQVGHRQAILRPAASIQHDYEGELAVIIGKRGRRIAKADALAHVAGWSCFNDGSIRDWQNAASQFIPGKNFPKSGAFGPWMVTTDEIPDATVLTLTTRLNGETVQRAPISDLVFDIPTLIEYCSAFTELAPGDVISTGTPSGVGAFRTPPLWLKQGDRIEVEIDRIGTLANTVEDEII